jgi:hypothetical protein
VEPEKDNPLEKHSLRLSWAEAANLSTQAANQLLVQVDLGPNQQPDMVILTIGHAGPPVVLGSRDEQIEQLSKISEVPVKPVIRVSVSLQRLREWAELLNGTLDKIDSWRSAAEERP